MYGSSLIGRQWAAKIAAIDNELRAIDPVYGIDTDELLEQRKTILDALFYSGELPTA